MGQGTGPLSAIRPKTDPKRSGLEQLRFFSFSQFVKAAARKLGASAAIPSVIKDRKKVQGVGADLLRPTLEMCHLCVAVLSETKRFGWNPIVLHAGRVVPHLPAVVSACYTVLHALDYCNIFQSDLNIKTHSPETKVHYVSVFLFVIFSCLLCMLTACPRGLACL